MRLINIDDECLKKTMAVGGISAKALWKRLQREPTVEAIPIEWIRKWYRRALDNSGFMGDETISVGDLLADWEKENE